MPAKRYKVTLSADERTALTQGKINMNAIKRLLILLIFSCEMLLFPAFSHQSAGEIKALTGPWLPSDIVFAAVAKNGDANTGPYVLALLDSETMQITELYRSDHFVPNPFGWSSQGDKLAFTGMNDTSMENGEMVEICILTVVDSHQTCLEDKLAYFGSILNEVVTWSEDGSKVYFVTLKQQTWRLIEVDVSTGKTLRVVYETPYSDDEWWRRRPTRWTDDLNYVGLEIGYARETGVLVNLKTNEEVIIHDILQPYIDPTVEQEHPGHIYICPNFSPSSNYLAALIPTGYIGTEPITNKMVIFDTKGEIIHLFEPSESTASCPTWTEDELEFYFRRYNRQEVWGGIFSYSLEHRQMRAWDMSGRETLPLILSPDEGCIAFQESVQGRTVVSVLYPGGAISVISNPYSSAWDPVWRPL